MPITTLSSHEVNQDLGWAEQAVRNGPVFITDHGRTTLVLLSGEEYGLLTNKAKSIGDLLSCPEAAEIEFDPSKMNLHLRPAEGLELVDLISWPESADIDLEGAIGPREMAEFRPLDLG